MEEQNKTNRPSGSSQDSPPNAMTNKKDVENSNDEKTDQDFPGYPHYPAKEDIMDQRSDSHRVDADVENLPNSNNKSGVGERFVAGGDKKKAAEAMIPGPATDDDLNIKMGNEADVTPDELKTLQDDMYMPTRDEDNLRAARLDSTDFEGDELNEESFGEEQTGADLDVPGSVDETTTTSMGQGDEENKYYSLGGDRQENLEEDPIV